MTKQKLQKRYKEIKWGVINKDFSNPVWEINLWKDETHPDEWHIRILIAYGKLYYTGDFGTFVFGRDIHNIKTFFIGDEINPYYWMEKCEASSEPLLDEHIDLEECRQKVVDYVRKYTDSVIEKENLEGFEKQDYEETVQQEIEDTFYHLEDYYIHAERQIEDLFINLEIDEYDAGDDARSIVHECRPYSEYYLYACETIQWVENNLEYAKQHNLYP